VKPIRMTAHARVVAANRRIAPDWIERVVRSPAWLESDPRDAALRRAFGAVPEQGGRVLRVVYGETTSECVIVTAFFDRDAGPGRRGA
jgi:hypothetical protein